MLLPSFGSWMYFVLFAGHGSWPRLLYALTKGTQLILPVTWLVLGRRQKLSGPAWQIRSATLGLLFGLASVIVVWLLYYWLATQTEVLQDTPQRLQIKLPDFCISGFAEYSAMALFFSILHAAFEEYYWRWFIFRQLCERWNWSYALIVSSLAFSLHHVIVIRAYLPSECSRALPYLLALRVAVDGAIWAWIYYHTSHIIGACLAHMLADLAIMGVGFDLLRGLWS